MTKIEFLGGLKKLSQIYNDPSFMEGKELWYDAFDSFSLEAYQKGIKDYYNTESYLPKSPALLKEHIKKFGLFEDKEIKYEVAEDMKELNWDDLGFTKEELVIINKLDSNQFKEFLRRKYSLCM